MNNRLPLWTLSVIGAAAIAACSSDSSRSFNDNDSGAGGQAGAGGGATGGVGGSSGTGGASGGAGSGGVAGSGGASGSGGAAGADGGAPDPFKPAPVAYLSFDDENTSSQAQDAIGTHHGTIVGATTGAQGKVNQAYSFDGIDDYVEFDTFSELTTSLTIAAWVELAGKPISFANPSVFDKWDWPNGKRAYALGTGHGNLAALVSVDGTVPGSTIVEAPTPPTLSTWIHTAMTYDGITVRLYQDGAKVGETGAEAGAQPVFVSTEKVIVGRSHMDSSPLQKNSYLDGKIDELAVWNTALSDAQLAEVHQRGVAGRRLDR